MNCPNCNAPYDGELKYCPECGHPLSNAHYTQLSDRKSIQNQKKSRRILLIIVILLLAAAAAGLIGYRVYLGLIEKKCREATDKIFAVAHDLDFSSVDPDLLPEELRDEPDVRSLIRSRLYESLNVDPDSIAGGYISKYLDTDRLLDDIVSSASYEILSTDADYHSCRVTVRTSNTDYSALQSTVYEELKKQISDTDSLWKAMRDFFSSIIGGDQEDSDNPDLSEKLAEIYRTAKEKTPDVSSTGTLTFGIEDGAWTLTDLDEDLFFSYYGISSFTSDAETENQ